MREWFINRKFAGTEISILYYWRKRKNTPHVEPDKFVNENVKRAELKSGEARLVLLTKIFKFRTADQPLWLQTRTYLFPHMLFSAVEHSSYFVACLFMLCTTVRLVSLCGKHSLAQATFRSYWNKFFDDWHFLYDE